MICILDGRVFTCSCSGVVIGLGSFFPTPCFTTNFGPGTAALLLSWSLGTTTYLGDVAAAAVVVAVVVEAGGEVISLAGLMGSDDTTLTGVSGTVLVDGDLIIFLISSSSVFTGDLGDSLNSLERSSRTSAAGLLGDS